MTTDLCTHAKLMLLVFLSLAIAGCERENGTPFFKSQSQSTASAPVLNVNVMRVTKIDNAEKISVFFGTLKPNRQSQLRFSQPGRVEQISKEVGETLQSGEQIASLESEAGSIVAPYDCIIASQNVVVGDLVSPQSLVLTVFEKQPVLVQANLPLKIARTLTTGREVWVVVGETSVKAEVKTISPIESTAGSRTVSFQINKPIEANWSFGQAVKIQFITLTENSGYWVPVSALSRESTGLWSALVVSEKTNQNADSADITNIVQRRILELVQLDDNMALTQGALVEGDLVIVNGSHRVVPGQAVNPTDVTAQYFEPSIGAGE